ncbi:desmethyl-deoxy-podophyllotoxin synthase-like [Oryza glaberrima]|uniref:desmethyl-deoxy-podophyllotoxin synthase-like n=1 Tax=Oryza glaberrima TaxID=4538 RepID=UPI00023E1C14|nr:desmethyl-deoxy-podophyllotoxin synthase-like [Oryza glaberrima]
MVDASDGDGYVYVGLAVVSLFVVLLAWRSRSPAVHGEGDGGLRLPPGPWTLPVIGSLHHLAGQLPHRAMRDLARRHGPVMLLRIGEVPTLVVSSRDTAREVMKTHDMAFATRPLSATLRVITCDGRDLVFAPYGDYWRQVRKIAVTELLTVRRVSSFRSIREEEVAAVLRTVAAAAAVGEAAPARTVEMRAALSALVTDIMARTAFGNRCKDREEYLVLLERIIEIAGGFNPADLWPSSRLAGRLSGVVRRAEACRNSAFKILDGIIQEHQERTGAGSEDLVDVLLRIQKEGELQFPLAMDDIKSIIFDIFNAGIETSGTTLQWAMAELIRNPTVMHKATAEVRHAFAAAGAVSEDALGELRYLQLVIRETLRLHPPLPLLLPRECREPCRVLCYDVPRGTQELVNAWAIGRDERYWPGGSPEEFRPERFDDGEATAAVDFRGADFELLPFGGGRRMCPGMAFGLANVELPLSSLLFHFDWEVPGMADPTKLDMTEAFGITSRRKENLHLRPLLRVSVPGV